MNSNKKKEAANSSFEEDLEKLETIVSTLETGNLPLNEALHQFEVGVGLVRKCEKALSNAERKIEMLVQGLDGEMEAEPFEETPEDSGSSEDAAPAPKPAPKKSAPRKVPASNAAPPEEQYPEPPPEDDNDDDELF